MEKFGCTIFHLITFPRLTVSAIQFFSKFESECYECGRIAMEHSIELESLNSSMPSVRSKCSEEWNRTVVRSKIASRSAQIHLVSCHPEVYEPCDDSFALVDALLADRANLLEHQPKLCMEIGCGSGYVITSLAIMLGQEVPGVYYIATDINPHATRVTCETLEAHGVHAEVINTDIASGLERQLEGLVDVMVVNPPYVPTPEEEVGSAGIAAAWAGGENGRSVIDRMIPVVDRCLSERGWLYMVTLTANNPSQICLVMRQNGYKSRIVVQRSTEEESLHVIKFWREKGDEEAELGGTNPGVAEFSWLSQFSRLSFWKK